MSDSLHHELQRHAAGLRDLARDLLRDPHAADDVTQAALQQALVQRDLQPGPLGGWLHRTVVNFARQWRRGERRRNARHAALPGPEPAPAVAEQLARRETLQRVTDAVLRLDEPYQTAVFLRYFEDLPPRAIARRTGTQVATVKSRLARGLAMLRTRLDHPHGERDGRWRLALVTTFGLPTAAAWPIPTGTLLVSTTPKILFAAGALCVGGLLAYQFRDDPAPVQARTAGQDDAAAATPVATTLVAPDAESARTAAPAAANAASWLDHPFEVGLDVLVVDSLGLPIEGHKLTIAPFACSPNEADHATGPDGRVALTWRSRQRTMDVQLVDPRGQTRRVALQQGARTQITLLGQRQRGGLAFVLGSKARFTTVDLKDAGGGTLKIDASALGALTGSSTADLQMHAGLHPAAVFGDLLAVVAPEATAARTEAGSELRLSFEASDVELLMGKARSVRGKPAGEELAAIDGVVFGSDGKPAAKVPVVLLGASPQPLQRGETDDQGRFRFKQVLAGEFTVRAGGDHQGLATTKAVVTQGVTPCTLNLQRGACVQGRAVDGAGKPRAEHTIEWRALDGSWCDATRTQADGTFLFANLPPCPGSLFLFARDGNKSIPIATAPSVLPDTADVVLAAAVDKGSVLRVEPPPRQEGQGAPTLLAWHSDTGLAIPVHAPDQGAVWSSPKLPAGFYDVELRVAGAGSRPLGRHWLDGEHDVDLGRVEAPRGGSLRITIPPGSLPAAAEQRELEVCALRADLDVRIEPAALPLDRTIHLPAGDYVLAFRHADGGVRFHRFVVKADRETVVAPAP